MAKSLSMSDFVCPTVRESPRPRLTDLREKTPWWSLLRGDVAASGPNVDSTFVLVLAAIVAVAYARPSRCSDFADLPLHTSDCRRRNFPSQGNQLRRLHAFVCVTPAILLEGYKSGTANLPQSFRDLCFALVVYVIRRYIEQRESLAGTVRQRRDDLLKDVELAGQVQRLFLPSAKPATPGGSKYPG